MSDGFEELEYQNENIALLNHDTLKVRKPIAGRRRNQIEYTKLYRIISKRTFKLENVPFWNGEELVTKNHVIEKGMTGGYVESIGNLGDFAWITNQATVFGDAKVFHHSMIRGNVRIFGDIEIYNSYVDHYVSVYCVGEDGTCNINGSVLRDRSSIGGCPSIDGSVMLNVSRVEGSPTLKGVTMSKGSMVVDGAYVENSTLEDTSEAMNDVKLFNCKLVNRAVIQEGEHRNESFSDIYDLNVEVGEGEL